MTVLVEFAPECRIIAAAIDKVRHLKKYAYPADPYTIALAFCMERLEHFLQAEGQFNSTTFMVVECRGNAEDARLELEFLRIKAGDNAYGPMPNLELRFMDKKNNSTGLQLADLVAYPIGGHVLYPNQLNRAFDTIEPKFRRNPFLRGRQIGGYGLKVFP